ncbi:MAG: YggT family protein [Clostridia bacterium]|nr:YggT family protein [Clostridia bacterium]
MNLFVYFLVSAVRLFLAVLQLLLIGRALLSWLPFDDDSPLQRFLFSVTEPIILPVRNFLDRFQFFSELPIDLSFMVVLLLINMIAMMLPAVYI